MTPLNSMLRLSLTPKSVVQKLMYLVDEFDEDDRGDIKAKKTSVSTKGPTGADYPSFNHVSHAISNVISNSARNVSNYLIADAKKVFDQLCNGPGT